MTSPDASRNRDFMAGIISLNCCSILGPNVDNAFTVKISRGETVDTLKDVIKEKNALKLDHIAAHELDVWKVAQYSRSTLPLTPQYDASRCKCHCA